MLAKSISGAAAAASPVFVEDTFSSYLYTGNGSTQTITNGIDLSGKGGLVWIKSRNWDYSHYLSDTARGVDNQLRTNVTNGVDTTANRLTAFNSSGFTLGNDATHNSSSYNYASWTFRKQAKFFDVVTYTGTGSATTIAHNLGSVPGCIIVKRTDTSADWQVYHRSSGNTKYLVLNSTAAEATSSTRWNDTTPTSTVFSVGTESTVNANGGTYVAYLFAHDAGGFGLAGTDNVISCGSYTGNGSATGPVVTLGYEPQWLLVKRTDVGGNYWQLVDVMRGMSESDSFTLSPNSADADNQVGAPFVVPTATGFRIATTGASVNANGSTYIYIAIRRGPMRVPTSGTSVFAPVATSAATGVSISTGFPVDMQIAGYRPSADTDNWSINDRLRGVSSTTTEAQRALRTSSTVAEQTASGNMTRAWNNNGFQMPSFWGGLSTIYLNFRRAPGFFDEVCYTGNGTNLAINHNLQAVPELIILKYRAGTSYGWKVTATGLTNPNTYYLDLNGTNAESNYTANFIYNRTSTTFTVVSDLAQSGWNWVAYLFATCAGVSKVGSYTGTGTTQQINCGFTGGARFVLIKRTDSTGDWYVWDTARGIVASTDPYLVLNSTAAEVTNTDWVDTYSAGFELSSAAGNNVNINGASYIFLSIA